MSAETTRRVVALIGTASPRPLPPRVSGRLRRANAIEVIEVVEGSPAALAGLRPEDLLVELDGVELSATDDLQRLMTAERIGVSCTLDVFRDGILRTVTLVPRELDL